MRKICKVNKGIIAILSLILVASFFCRANLSSIKADTANNIAINYSTYQTRMLSVKFAEYPNIPEAPNGGFVFLVVNMTIENSGYDRFNTDPGLFYVIANNVKYNFDWATNMVNNWTTIDIPNGGTLTGTLVFQIPENNIVNNIGYGGIDNQSQSFHIVWNSVTPSPTPSHAPTAIPSSTPTSTHAFPETTQRPTSTPISSSSPISFWLIVNTISLIVIAILLAVIIALLLLTRQRKTVQQC